MSQKELNPENYNIVLNVDNDSRKKPLDLFVLLDVALKHKFLLIAAAVVFGLAGILLMLYQTPSYYTASATVIFNFEGIEKGLDPAGKKFDIGMIRSPYVINEAVKDLKLERFGMTPDDVRNAIEIEPIIPGYVTEKVQQMVEAQKQSVKSMEEYEYYPNRYVLRMNLYKGWKLGRDDAKQILDSLVRQYSEFFYKTYSPSPYVSDAVTGVKLDTYDYPDMSEILVNQITLINSFVTNKSAQSPDFRSVATGLSFDDIFKSVELVRTVDLDTMNSLIDSYNLTKDKTTRIRLYEYKIKQLSYLMNKKTDEAKVVSTSLDRMERYNQILYTPNKSKTDVDGVDMDINAVELVNPKYNELIGRQTDSGVAATNAKHDIDDYKVRIQKLTKDSIPAPEKQFAIEHVMELSGSIQQKLTYWIDKVNKTATDYYQSLPMNEAVKPLSPSTVRLSISKIKLAVFGGGGAFGGLVVLYALLLLSVLSKQRKRAQEAAMASDNGENIDI